MNNCGNGYAKKSRPPDTSGDLYIQNTYEMQLNYQPGF